MMNHLSEFRERFEGEIVPVSAEHSNSHLGDDEQYGIQNAIDLDNITYSYSRIGDGSSTWMQLNFDKVRSTKIIISIIT